jgi:hypothetical protein
MAVVAEAVLPFLLLEMGQTVGLVAEAVLEAARG